MSTLIKWSPSNPELASTGMKADYVSMRTARIHRFLWQMYIRIYLLTTLTNDSCVKETGGGSMAEGTELRQAGPVQEDLNKQGGETFTDSVRGMVLHSGFLRADLP